MRWIWLVTLALMGYLAVNGAEAQDAGKPERLRCEYLENPQGIDTVRPRLSWQLPGGLRHPQVAYRVLVASSREPLDRERGDLWDSGRVSSPETQFIAYAGRPLRSREACFWKVRVWLADGRSLGWSAPASWSMGLLDPAEWRARWIGQARPAGTAEGTPLPFPWLRKSIQLARRPTRASAYINALGYFELYVNGRRVGDVPLEPTTSDFSRRNLYVTHDITRYLREGTNVLSLWLGRGWYVRGHPGVVHDGPLVRAQFHLDDEPPIVTDGGWKVRESPLYPLGRGTAFGDYGGERYDARKDLPNWADPDLNDSDWQTAAEFNVPPAETVAHMVEPNRITATVPASRITTLGPDSYLVEMERTLTGWLEITLPRVEAGKTIRLDYSDFPYTTGRWQTHNQRDEVISDGREALTFRSRFNYHGFGWVRITGIPRPPVLDAVKGHLIHTDYDTVAEFECSSDLYNRIHRLTTWTYRNLTLGGYVVDCPTRERLGYGGDAGTSFETGMFNFNTAGLYTRWLGDWRTAQHPETGDLPYTAPHYPNRGGGGPMWSGFVVTLPWQLYLHYGDRGVLERNYPLISKWLAFAHSKTRDGVLEFYKSYGIFDLPQWNFLGDWVPPKPSGGKPAPFGDPESAKFINNCHYLYQLQLAARIARLLGKEADAALYQGRAVALGQALHRLYYRPETATYASGEQPYLAFPLMVGLTPPELREAVARRLDETIRVTNRGHIDAGMHGAYFLMEYLMAQDRDDLIHLMVGQKTFPGWGYMVEMGASTAWEDWEGNGSRIHDTLISVGSWFIQGVGGIRIDESAPGFRHFYLQPAPGNLTFARTRFRSPQGWIVSDWKREGEEFQLKVTVPAGSTATVLLPTRNLEGVRLEGRRTKGEVRGRRTAVKLPAGRHTLTCRMEG